MLMPSSTFANRRRVLPCLLFLAAGVPVIAQTPPAIRQRAPSGIVTGRVLDPSGAVVRDAAVVIRSAEGIASATVTDAGGRFLFKGLLPGRAEITADGPGFAQSLVEVVVADARDVRVDITLEIGGLNESVQVVPDRIIAGDEAARRIPGSVTVLDLPLLEQTRPFTTADVLRKASGVHVREEEGVGLRPNIGIRGLNPTRSSRVLLLEDGIPLTYAPYGDNAAYYHPPIERFERVELLKGAGQIAYGPMTVGGVINYVTPTPPGSSRGSAAVSVGNRGYFNARGGWGTTLGSTGLLLDFMRKQGDGARDNVSAEVNDLNTKLVARVTDRQVVTFRASYYGEDSNLTYSGLREDEYRADPRQNPFKNDYFYVDRFGTSATHTFAIAPALVATTNVYASNFRRHWWRQSSNSSQRPNDASDPACVGMANLDTTCGNEGRLRRYVVWGVEPRFRAISRLGSISNETDFGVRVHVEDQERRQENGPTPAARSGVVVENNERRNVAYAGFVQNRLIMGAWSVTPGIRVERVEYERTNRLAGVSGRTGLVEIIPGIGAAYSPRSDVTVFAGIHRGFTPPRTEDIINNSTGGVVDLEPERSWNSELGMRGRVMSWLQLEAAVFRMDYENQVIPATLAGGVGSMLTNGGQTVHQGLELGAQLDSAAWKPGPVNVYARTAYTWLPVARFAGVRYSSVPGFTNVSVTDNRLPYAPENLLSAGVGVAHANGLDLNLEAVVTGEQFGDDLNTIAPTPDGQRGLLPAHTVWNAAANYRATRGLTLFVAVKNLLDRTVVVDRSRGLLPGMPRTVHGGLKVAF